MARGRPAVAGTGVLRLGTRGSSLALRQAQLATDHLRRVVPDLAVETVLVHTRGDRMAQAPLDRIAGQGAFVKEVQEAVLDGRADVAVHSAKDLPPVTPDGLVLAGVPERADPRDALVGGRLWDLPTGATVATGSPRRRAQLANLRPDLTFAGLRGNVGTRIDRVDGHKVLAVVVAAAALERLGISDRPVELLAPTLMLPQVGQGTLALECRSGDEATRRLLAAVDHPRARASLLAERAMLAAMGASCTVPVAGWAEVHEDGALRLHGMIASGDGRVVVRTSLCGREPEALGRELGELLLRTGGPVVEAGPVAP